MIDEEQESSQNEKPARRPIFERNHERRSVGRWLFPLLAILAVIYFLPRVLDLVLTRY